MKVAIVTGANKGIGFCIARKLATSGCRVVMACRDSTLAERAMTDIRSTVPGADLRFLQMDIADSDDVDRSQRSKILTKNWIWKKLDYRTSKNKIINEALPFLQHARGMQEWRSVPFSPHGKSSTNLSISVP